MAYKRNYQKEWLHDRVTWAKLTVRLHRTIAESLKQKLLEDGTNFNAWCLERIKEYVGEKINQ